MTASLQHYDETIGHHLREIQAGADICLRHVKHLAARPEFATLAYDDLDRATEALLSALVALVEAKKQYREKLPDAGIGS